MVKWIYPDPAVTYGIRDIQQDEPVCYCDWCLREIYDYDETEVYNGVPLCRDCYEEVMTYEDV